MSETLLDTLRTEERREEWMEWRWDDPAVVARTTRSLGSYGWRWLLFLSEQNSRVLTPRAPFWDG